MRNWHRWIMTVMVVILVYWTLTGLALQVYDMQDPEQSWAGDSGEYFQAMMRARDAALDDAQLTQMLESAQQQAGAQAPGSPITAVDLRNRQGIATVLVTVAGGRQISINTTTGTSDPVASGMGGNNPHNIIKTLHRGNVIGLPGIFLGLFSGIAIVALAVTGFVMYLQLRAARVNAGRTGWFWRGNSESAWRYGHRWISLVAAVFLLNTAISGGLLAIDEIQVRFTPGFPGDRIFFGAFSSDAGAGPMSMGGMAGMPGSMMGPLGGMGGGPPGATLSNDPLPESLSTLLQNTLRAVRTRHDAPVTQVRLRMDKGQPQGLVVLQQGEQLAINALTGEFVPSPASQSLNYHQLLKSIHRGDIIGFNGRWMAIATGLSLLFLCVSSIVMYLQLRARRATVNRRGWFWR